MAANAMTQTVKDVMAGWGYANVAPASVNSSWRSLSNACTTAGPNVVTLALPGPIQKGIAKARYSNFGGAAGTVAFTLTGTDGTSTVDLANAGASQTIQTGIVGTEVMRVVHFITELQLTSVTLTTTETGTNGTCTLDFEIFGTLGGGALD
jgi:hypothetical protein